MPPKGKKSGGGKGQAEADEVEESLQAVVLADSFETRFRPLTLEKPRCLLPLANTPLIEYTLEFLAASGVQEVYLYCGAHTAQVEAYIQASIWATHRSPFDHFEILRSTSTSVGDAMRDLDKRNILTDDFLVVYGDVVSNIPLQKALAIHRARKAADKNCIMTMLLRQTDIPHRTKAQEVLSTFVLEAGSCRCLAYEQIPVHRSSDDHADRGRKGGPAESRAIELDDEILAFDEMQIRTDLIDCGIDIATPDMLALWSDNFDYEEPRRGFLHSVLKDYELNGKKIHAFIEEDGYAARVRNLRTYGAVSEDIMGRWTYPMVPDTNLVKDQTYRLHKGGAYREEGVVLAANCELGKRTVIGRATAIGDGAVLKDSVVGRRCVIGRNVKLQGCYIWDDVTIGDGSVVTNAVIANEASLGRKCTVEDGAIISYGCHISDGTTVTRGTKITRMLQTGDGEELTRGESDMSLVGKGGEGFLFEEEDDDVDEGRLDLGSDSLYGLGGLSLSQESISTIHSQGDLSLGSDAQRRGSRTASFGSDLAAGLEETRSASPGFMSSDTTQDITRRAKDFHRDASTQLYESLQQEVDWSNIQLELTGLRLASDADPHWVRRALVAAFMKHISTLMEGGLSAAQAVKKSVTPQENLLKRTFSDYGDKHSAKTDQVDFLLLMQSDLRHRKEGEKIMLFMSNELAMQDIVETDGFMQWWENSKSTEGEDMVQVRSMMQPFIDAIDDEESEEDDEDEDEDDED